MSHHRLMPPLLHKTIKPHNTIGTRSHIRAIRIINGLSDSFLSGVHDYAKLAPVEVSSSH